MRTNEAIRKTIVDLYLSGKTRNEIASITGVKSSQTIYKILNNAGVIGKERAATQNAFSFTINDPEIALWLQSQDIENIITEAYNKAKLVYSQIEGSSEKSNTEERNSRIADSTVSSTDDPTEITVDFYTKKKEYLGTETIFSTYKLAFDILKQYKDSKYHDASYAETKDGETIFSFEI